MSQFKKINFSIFLNDLILYGKKYSNDNIYWNWYKIPSAGIKILYKISVILNLQHTNFISIKFVFFTNEIIVSLVGFNEYCEIYFN